MRLLHRDGKQRPSQAKAWHGTAEAGSLAEGDCYDHSYGDEGVHGNVEVVRPHTEPPADPAHHVTTKRLKQQFEERLAARPRRRR